MAIDFFRIIICIYKRSTTLHPPQTRRFRFTRTEGRIALFSTIRRRKPYGPRRSALTIDLRCSSASDTHSVSDPGNQAATIKLLQEQVSPSQLNRCFFFISTVRCLKDDRKTRTPLMSGSLHCNPIPCQTLKSGPAGPHSRFLPALPRDSTRSGRRPIR